MKKHITIILAVLMIMTSTALAEGPGDLSQEELYLRYEETLCEIMNRSSAIREPAATTEKEILFRGIPWGVSAVAFEETLRQEGVSGSVRESEIFSWEGYHMSSILLFKKRIQLDGSTFVYQARTENLAVGGFRVASISAHFISDHDAKTVSHAAGQSELYLAEYKFDDVVDKSAAYEVLRAKLNGLYGEGVSSSLVVDYNDRTRYNDYCEWYGENDTGIRLMHDYVIMHETGEIRDIDSLYILYGRTDSVERINALEAALAREQLEAALASENDDGL